jgi:hypothetical protein
MESDITTTGLDRLGQEPYMQDASSRSILHPSSQLSDPSFKNPMMLHSSELQAFSQVHNPEIIETPSVELSDAIMLENMGNQSDQNLLLQSTPKRKEVTEESPYGSKRQKTTAPEDGGSDEEFGEDVEQQAEYDWQWSPFPYPEPLPITVTLPYIRAFATKKFDAPISLMVPPSSLPGTLHHYPALLTLPPLLSLPTCIPLLNQMNYMNPMGGYQYGGDEGEFYEEESEGESYEDEEVLDESVDLPTPNKHLSSGLTTLASLASGSVNVANHR